MAWSTVCPVCKGTRTVPNNDMSYRECELCYGSGWISIYEIEQELRNGAVTATIGLATIAALILGAGVVLLWGR